MDLPMQMEQFSRAFVGAVAAQAGCNPGKPEVDDHSVDLTLSMNVEDALFNDPEIGIQLKATRVALQAVDDVLKYPLHSMKNYNDLRKTNLRTPRILVVVCVPDDTNDWIQYHDDSISLYKNAYWVSLRGMPESQNSFSITVDIPVSQRFDVTALRQMMRKVANGEDL